MPINSHSKPLLLILAMVAGIYLQGIGNWFLFDDAPTIQLNSALQIRELSLDAARQAAQSSESGPLGRPVSMLSFWINYHFSGLDARGYKLTNIGIHLFNTAVFYWLCLLIVRAHLLCRRETPPNPDWAHKVALTAAALWSLHPLQLTSVLYVTQRMTSLSALFQLLAAICYVSARLRLMRGQAGFGRLLTGFAAFGLLALFSKENGALLPLYLFAIETTLFSFRTAKREDRGRLYAFFAATVGVPAIAALGYFLIPPGWLLDAHLARGYTLVERLLTESRVIWLYLRWTALPLPTSLGLYHDDVEASAGLLAPWTSALALAGIGALLIAAVLSRRRWPMFSFGAIWFLFGHALESTVIPLELIHEHRNYLPLTGLLLAAAYGLHSIHASKAPRIANTIAFACAAALFAANAVRAHHWSDPILLMDKEVEHHPLSSRANFDAASHRLSRQIVRAPDERTQLEYEQIRLHLQRALDLNPTVLNPYPVLIASAAVHGFPVDDRWLADMADRLRTRRSDPIRPLLTLVDLTVNMSDGPITEDQLLTLFGAALENPGLSPTQKGQLLTVLARYFARERRDYQQAVQLLIAATEYAPESMEIRIPLARLAISLGNKPYAKEQIARLKSLDSRGRYSYTIRELETALISAQ